MLELFFLLILGEGATSAPEVYVPSPTPAAGGYRLRRNPRPSWS
jgi:hypothetical protein